MGGAASVGQRRLLQVVTALSVNANLGDCFSIRKSPANALENVLQ
jgi:hypothetical protein